jgi:hypothetical protein
VRVRAVSILWNMFGEIKSIAVHAAAVGKNVPAGGLFEEVQLRERQRLRMHLCAWNKRQKL